MEFNLNISTSQTEYLVTSTLEGTFAPHKKRLVICDRNIHESAVQAFPDAEFWVLVTADEELKTLGASARLLEEIAELGVTREYQIIAVGGGSVQDTATLVASLYMRGLEWIYMPTTLMSMMDSCIGGKSSINLGRFKNIVGNFYPPSVVFIEPRYVQTLSPKDISCGIAEGMKICFAASPESLENFTQKVDTWRDKGLIEDLLEAIFYSLDMKKWFIEIDEFDRKERKLLNFGHSFGHALEAATSFAVPHGIGVLIGMQAAIIHAKSGEHISLSDSIRKEILSSLMLDQKIQISRKTYLEALAKDKKNSATIQNLVLPNSAGNLIVQSFPLTQSALDNSLESLEMALTKLGFSYEVL